MTIPKPFWLGKYEVTQEQWEAVMGNNPSQFKGAKNPVECVSWNSQNTTHPVGQKSANAWGLHDLHGNVWEWCASPYVERYDGNEQKGGEAGGNFRVLRGGSWNYGYPGNCRSAARCRVDPGVRYSGDIGFRAIRSARTSE
jgi:formylglycine-generating enzyme required for sulfatase activity